MWIFVCGLWSFWEWLKALCNASLLCFKRQEAPYFVDNSAYVWGSSENIVLLEMRWLDVGDKVVGWGIFFWIFMLINGMNLSLIYYSINAVFVFSSEYSGPEMLFYCNAKKKINNKNYCKDKNLTDYRVLYSTVIFSYSVIVPNMFKYQEAVDYHNI